MIKIFIYIVLLSIPLTLFFLDVSHPEVEGRFLFTFFVIIAMAERMWETFYTPKGKEVRKFHGDWTLLATIFAYYIVCLILIFEFYSTNAKNFVYVFLGLLIFLGAGVIRLYSVKVLGEQWDIHLVENYRTTNKLNLIKTGPYRYVRHPIYLAAILELVGITFIVNSFYFLFIIFLVNTPLYLWRAIYEEKINIKKFGYDYVLYKKKVPLMIPWKLFIKTNND